MSFSTFLFISLLLFLWFVFSWGFRLVVLVLVLKIASKVKENIEKSVKEKIEGFKGDRSHD